MKNIFLNLFVKVCPTMVGCVVLLLLSSEPVVAQTITEIIDATGDGAGNLLTGPRGIAVDSFDNVYVVGANSNRAFKITPGGVITEIINATGDGAGNPLNEPREIAVDGSGNVYVTGGSSDNAFKITPGGVITEIIDATGALGPAIRSTCLVASPLTSQVTFTWWGACLQTPSRSPPVV